MAKKTIDLSKHSLAELGVLKSDIDKSIRSAERKLRKDALAAAESAAKKMGFALSELVGTSPKRRKSKAASPPKYRHPENPSVTWSGRGRQPEWYKEALAAGKKPEDLAV
jgi:DNA-binding protein H-NS